MSAYTPSEFTLASYTLKPDNYSAASTDGAEVDTKGFRRALIVLAAGTAAASAEADVKIQSSDASGSGFADVTGATFAQITAANDETTYVANWNCDLNKRYIRAVCACDGTNQVELACVVVLLDPEVGPATQTNAVAFSK